MSAIKWHGRQRGDDRLSCYGTDPSAKLLRIPCDGGAHDDLRCDLVALLLIEAVHQAAPDHLPAGVVYQPRDYLHPCSRALWHLTDAGPYSKKLAEGECLVVPVDAGLEECLISAYLEVGLLLALRPAMRGGGRWKCHATEWATPSHQHRMTMNSPSTALDDLPGKQVRTRYDDQGPVSYL